MGRGDRTEKKRKKKKRWLSFAGPVGVRGA